MAQDGQHEVTNTSRLTNTLLNGKNYLSWAKAAARALSGREMLEYITGEIEKPKMTNATAPTEAEKKELKKWKTENDRVITWLMNSMEPSIADLFQFVDTTTELWEALKAMYGQQNNYSRIYTLKQEIQQEKQGTRSNIEYLGALKKKKDELRFYRPPTSDLSVIRQREEEDDIFEYLAGLNPSYEAVQAQIMNTIPLPSYTQIQNMIQQEEGRREAMGSQQTVVSEKHETHGFVAAKKPGFHTSGQNPRFSNQSVQKKGGVCTHCKKEGHTHEGCWFLHPHLKPEKWRSQEKERTREGFNVGREREKKNHDRVFVSQADGFSGFNPKESSMPNFNYAEPNKEKQAGPSLTGPEMSSGQQENLQKMFEQFSIWFSNQTTPSSCGPGNRDEDWGRNT